MYLSELDKVPRTPLTDYLFNGNYEKMVTQFNIIDNQINKQRNENLKKFKGLPGI